MNRIRARLTALLHDDHCALRDPPQSYSYDRCNCSRLDELLHRTIWHGRAFAVFGGRRPGWLVTPHLNVDGHTLAVGVYWRLREFEDEDPLVSVHVPGLSLWFRIYRIRAGFRTSQRCASCWRARWRERPGDLPRTAALCSACTLRQAVA